ncbi:MAG TPA: carboxymuconolactone decarboxylase family protein [Pseudolabrys sp.]|nr:carboxymuconolactone decarboxylase family protein [Pseudolabrys sp.]
MPAKRPAPRLPAVPEEAMTAAQRELYDAIRSGPRGRVSGGGPFATWLHAPAFGQHAQRLGAHVRYHTALSPRLSEFAILVTARLWRAHYEWFAHEPHAAKAGISAATIADLRAGRVPKRAAKDERAIHDFIREVYKNKRVSNRTYARVHAFLGDGGMVELVGILGYYAMISMTLNVFRMLPPADAKLPFGDEKGG